MDIEEIAIGEIIPYENNPRINDDSVELVAKSISEFGFKKPIILDRNKVIICGHTRLEAAKKLGLEKCPCIIAGDLTPKQVKALRLADNKVSEESTWDFSKLQKEIDSLDGKFDMCEFGFEPFNGEGIDGIFDSENHQEVPQKEAEIKVCPYCGHEDP